MCCLQNMVEARNANYATILRHLSFAKRGAPNVELEGEGQGTSRSEKQHVSADTYDNGSDSDTEAPEPRLLRVRLSIWTIRAHLVTSVNMPGADCDNQKSDIP